MSEEVLLISNLTAQCKWLLRAISDRLLGSSLRIACLMKSSRVRRTILSVIGMRKG